MPRYLKTACNFKFKSNLLSPSVITARSDCDFLTKINENYSLLECSDPMIFKVQYSAILDENDTKFCIFAELCVINFHFPPLPRHAHQNYSL